MGNCAHTRRNPQRGGARAIPNAPFRLQCKPAPGGFRLPDGGSCSPIPPPLSAWPRLERPGGHRTARTLSSPPRLRSLLQSPRTPPAEPLARPGASKSPRGRRTPPGRSHGLRSPHGVPVKKGPRLQGIKGIMKVAQFSPKKGVPALLSSLSPAGYQSRAKTGTKAGRSPTPPQSEAPSGKLKNLTLFPDPKPPKGKPKNPKNPRLFPAISARLALLPPSAKWEEADGEKKDLTRPE